MSDVDDEEISSALIAAAPVAGQESNVSTSSSLLKKCRHCQAAFSTDNQRRRHYANVHKVEVTIATGEFTTTVVKRNPSTTKFHCYFDGCEAAYGRADLLATHCKNHFCPTKLTKDSQTKKRDVEEKKIDLATILPIDEDETPADFHCTCLRRVIINSVVFLVCQPCGKVLPPCATQVLKHMKKEHDITARKHKRQQLALGNESNEGSISTYPTDEQVADFICNGGFTQHDLPEIKPWIAPARFDFESLPPIPGVAIVAAYQCTKCASCVISKHSLRTHKCIPGERDFASVMVQKPLSGVPWRYVRVSYSMPEPIEASVIEAQLREDSQRISALGLSDLPSQKQRNAWLRQSEWPELASTIIPEGACYESIVAAVEKKNQNGPLEHLYSLVTAYMSKFKEVARSIDYRFRRLVMGVDEYNRVPARGLRLHAIPSTSAYYCRYLCNFVAGLLSAELKSDEENMLHLLGNLDAQQTQCRSGLILYLQGRTSDENNAPHNLLPFHHFLLSLWKPANDETGLVNVLATSQTPVLRYLLISSLKKGFDTMGYGFQHVSTVTGRCSVLVYWIRMTTLMEIGATMWHTLEQGVPLPTLTLE
jgi:hypothetical protein